MNARTPEGLRDALGERLAFEQQPGGSWIGLCPRCGVLGAEIGTYGLTCATDGCGVIPLDEAWERYQDGALPIPVKALGAEIPPPPVFTVDQLLVEREIHALAGDGGVGKTATGLAVGGAYAAGTCAFDRADFSVRLPGDVLYVSEEDGLGVLLNRLEALIRGHGWAREDVLSRFFFLAQEGANLDSPRWQEHLIAAASGLDRPLVIFDPLAELTVATENSNDEAKPLIRFFRRLTTEAGATVIVSVHAGKAHEGQRRIDRAIRGASSWFDAARAVYLLERSEMGVALECVKMNRGVPTPRFVVRVDVESDPANRASWTSARLSYLEETAADDMAAERFVLDLLRRHPESTSSAIRDAAKVPGGPNQFDVSEAIRTLEAVGRIQYKSGPRGSKLWTIRDPAEPARQGTLPTLPDPAGQGPESRSDDPADPVFRQGRVRAGRAEQAGQPGRVEDDAVSNVLEEAV